MKRRWIETIKVTDSLSQYSSLEDGLKPMTNGAFTLPVLTLSQYSSLEDGLKLENGFKLPLSMLVFLSIPV